ncbi:MAG TPA: hypothetical protein VFA77_00740, partial [Candidatus Eisenbacteria bacterium]|nr:hypothetical protein [Candidatus Eisenbacteria bacterium]
MEFKLQLADWRNQEPDKLKLELQPLPQFNLLTCRENSPDRTGARTFLSAATPKRPTVPRIAQTLFRST